MPRSHDGSPSLSTKHLEISITTELLTTTPESVLGQSSTTTPNSELQTPELSVDSPSASASDTPSTTSQIYTAASASISLLAPDSFNHPGLLHTSKDFARIRENVQNGTEPWATAWNKLRGSQFAEVSYEANPVEIVYRGSDGTNAENYYQLYHDTAAAYALAIRWAVTQDSQFGDAAISIMDSWSSTLKELSGTVDLYLAAGIYGYQFAQAAEIMRDYDGWSESNFINFQTMMIDVFYVKVNKWFEEHDNWGGYGHGVYPGWDLSIIASAMSIGVLVDNQTIYNQGIQWFTNGTGNGQINQTVPFTHWYDNQLLGQTLESGRDQGHNNLDIALMCVIAQVGFNQGNDLFSYNGNSILAAAEYVARYNLGYDVPYTAYDNDWIDLPTISNSSRGDLRPTWELLYNHYGILSNSNVTWTKQYRDLVVSDNGGAEGGSGDYGENSGGYDQLGWGTLLYTLKQSDYESGAGAGSLYPALMEALGVAASVAGLISLAVEIPKLIDTAISIRSAPDEAKQLSQTADTLITTLQRLEEFLKTDEARDMNMADDSALIVSISACQDRILTLSKKLRSYSPRVSGSSPLGLHSIKTTAIKFRWPLDKTECMTLISEIHAMQSTFEFCLVIKNCQEMAKSHKEVIARFKAQSETLAQMGASFPDQAAHVSTMLEKIQVVESCVSDAAQRLSHIQVGLEELQKMKNDLAEHYADKLHGEALEWLSPIDPSAKHEEVKATRMPGTCEQILSDADFQRWVKSPPSKDYSGVSCWVGDPGQGKTCTMSRIIDHLQHLHPPGSKIYTTYLYCDYQRTKSYSETHLLGAIVRQLLTQFDELPTKVADLVRHAHRKLRRSSARMEEILKVMQYLSPSFQRLFVCVDALDECKDAVELVAACRRFPPNTSFIFVGRPSILQAVRRSYPSAFDQVMEPQYDDVDTVITARVEVEKERQPDLMPDWLVNEIRAEVLLLANGM
ncbi:hypothetical protein G7Z17_g4705 [Cylindrodendrum hubeiense]|uniref:NACHT domain-containing protein n=1 Tax=Cylindrodendrum hubeiense TaxID=595255 RepID=A0A9P5HAC0_9HYPO|nr:hypothetical protein G7Z17_g4705 [Cylindrodendrum hubeiense]